MTAIDGSVIAISAASICVHGDTPGAHTLARNVRRTLEGAGVIILSFVP